MSSATILTAILILIVVGVIWVAFLYILLFIISKTLYPLAKWILKQESVQRLLFKTRQLIDRFWERYKYQFIGLWEFTSEVLIDPIFLGFVIFTLDNRLQSLINYTQTNPQYNFWDLLNADMNKDTTFYFWFIAIFTIWVMGKTWKHNQDVKRDNKIIKTLNRIDEQLGSEPIDIPNIGITNKQIRENLKKIREVNKNEESKPNDKELNPEVVCKHCQSKNVRKYGS